MKFHWGHGIAVFLGIFLISMGFVVYKAFQQDNPLVELEYYPKGLVYEKQIQRIQNANRLPEKIKVEVNSENVVVVYPADFLSLKPEGTVYFYRPSNEKGDLTEKMICDSSLRQNFKEERLMNGKYIIKLTWKMGGKEYYQEEVVHIVGY